jgi:hypothetical protein
MNRFTAVLGAAMLSCSALFAFQPLEQPGFTSAQIRQFEQKIARSLESPSPSAQFEAAMMLHRLKGLAPAHDWDRCIIPLMRILNGENNEPPNRLLAALVLHELRTERGDFAIARNAQFTDDARVKRYCMILSRTRLIEKTKM